MTLVFYFGLSLLFVHELDAVKRHEWRILPFLSRLTDEAGYVTFVLAHVPLFMLIFWLVCSPSPEVRFRFQIGMDLFLIAHLGLHRIFENRSGYEFTSVFSKTVIRLAALSGTVHLVVLLGRNHL